MSLSISLPRNTGAGFLERGTALIVGLPEKPRAPQAPHSAYWQDGRGLITNLFISRKVYFALLAVILCGGTFLRFYPTAAPTTHHGFDEVVYASYVSALDRVSLFDYPEVCRQYLAVQQARDEALLPPTRFSFVYAGHVWRELTGESPFASLTHVSALFTALTLLLTAAFCYRLAGPVASLGVTALMCVSMNQIHQAQHAMIDGFFTFWTLLVLWGLWENLRQPGRTVWLLIYASTLAALVMTKENAFFVFVALCGLLMVNRWLKFGVVTRPLIVATFGGASFGFGVLLLLSGGLDVFLEMYRLLVAKSTVLPYAIMTGDGPWYRYLVDLTLVSPLLILLAAGTAFQLRGDDKSLLFLLIFLGCTFAVMASVKYGCNLRYTTIWDMPLRLLAFTQLGLLARRFGRRGALILTLATCALCAFELRQYFIFCVGSPTYALLFTDLLHATNILK